MWNATGPDSNRSVPPGVVPDFDNPEDVYWTLNIVITVICVVFSTILFCIRLYVKLGIQRRFVTEDVTCIVAYILLIIFCMTILMLARYGGGYHAWEIRQQEYYNWLKEWFYASTIIYCPAAFFTKATILLLMARVFAIERKVSKGIRWFIWFLLAAYVPIQFCRIFTCFPIRTYWDPSVRNAHCINQRKLFFSSLSLSILSDLIILLIPIPLTWRLQMLIRKKVKIVLLLGAGGIATALAMFRAYKLAEFLDSDDITVDYTPIGILTVLEISIGFVCACFPSLNLLIEHLIRKTRRERQNPRWPRDRNAFQSKFMRHCRWISSSTDPSAQPPSRGPQHLTDHTIDFDVELAMITGRPVGLHSGLGTSTDFLGCRPLDHRLNSGAGRQDGWLTHHPDAGDERQNAGFISRVVTKSEIQAEESHEEGSCPVWDGPGPGSNDSQSRIKDQDT